MQDFLYWVIVISTFAISLIAWLILNSAFTRTRLNPRRKGVFSVLSAFYLFGWSIGVFALAQIGVFKSVHGSVIPSILMGLATTLPIATGLLLAGFSKTLRTVVDGVPDYYLIALQVYRVLGAVFIAFYLLNKLPGEFALPAGIGDVVVGASAPLVAYLLVRRFSGATNIAIAWNAIGILDLVSAVAFGFLTSPSPLQAFAFNNPNLLITNLPLALVPAFAVPLSIVLHVISLRKLLKKRESQGSAPVTFKGSGERMVFEA